ncbi:MAG TPA: hypothetical protein VFJ46_17860 [Xanthobacteraceae bacterium]|nr:hypothetical protein [Xanthobacteraceae bacterium]
MDDGTPTLEVGFAIEPTYAELITAQEVMNSAEAKIVADAKNIERATSGMLKLGGATAGIQAFGGAATRELAATERSAARAEKAGEALSRQMERQIATFGMTRAAAAALVAEQNGLGELAERLRAQEAQLASMRDQAAAAALREADAAQRQAAAHADLAAKVRASHDAQEADALAAERMRMATDPLYAATVRLNAEIAESTRLYHAGATAPAEYARQQEVLAQRLSDVERRHSAVNQGLGTVGNTGKLASHHVQNLAFQFQDLSMQMAMAAQSSRPFSMAMMALFQQGTQINGVMSQAGIGMGGLLKQVLAMVAPFTGLAAAAGLFGAALWGVKQSAASDAEMQKFAGTLGLTKKEMEKLKDVGVTWGDTMGGVFDTLAERLGFTADGLKSWFGDAFKKIGEFGKFSVAILVGAFYAGITGIGRIVMNLPAMVAEGIVGAVNLGIAGIEKLVNLAIGAMNKVIEGVNGALGTSIPTIGTVALERMQNQFAGTTKGVVQGIMKDMHAGFDATMKFFDDSSAAATKRAENRLRKQAQDIKDDRTPKKNRPDRSAEALAREIAATEALIKGNYDLAAAYQVSDAAAFEAEIRAKATAEAIKKKADVEAYVAQQMRLAISQAAVDAGKAGAELRGQASAQRAVNDALAAGTISAEAAQTALRNEAQLRPLLIKYAAAEGAEKVKLGKAIEFLRIQQAAANAETNRGKVLADTAAGREKLEQLRLEAKLIGATNEERARAIALLQAEQYLKANPGASPAEAKAYAQTMADIAVQTEANATAQNNYNASLSYTRDLLGAIGDQAGVLSNVLSDAFGGFGDSIGGLLTTLTDYQTQQQAIADWRRDEMKKAGSDATRQAQIEVLAAKASQTAQMKATAQAISGVKSLFKEKSAAFKAISAIEKAYALWQAAETIASMVRDTTKTASHLANSAVRTTANTAEGGSKIFAELGPWAFPVVAAMVAVLAALGAKAGGGGGGGGPSIPTSDDLQAGAGTGSVLGDPKAKSESIARSLEIVANNTNKDLEYTNAMLQALRSIDTSISKLAGTVAKQILVNGGMFDTSKLKLGSSGSGGFLGIGAKSTTRTLWDQGINLASSSVADIIANGIDGFTYSVVQKVKKSSGFLGIGGGTKTSYETTKGALDGDIAAAIQEVVTSLRDGLLSAADVIGLQGAEAILNGFQVKLGQISFKGMTGEEIEDQLNAIFSKVGDDMAGAIFPTLTQMQKVGEGLFETFIRVAREYEVVDIALESIGRTFGAVGVSSVAARDALVQLFGGLDEFVEATSTFRDEFLSEAEQIAPIQAAVREELARLGMASIQTREQFKAAVLGLDLTTAAGRDMYAALLQVAPAFDKVLDYVEQANKAQIDTLQKTVDQFSKFAESLKKYRNTLFQTDAAQANAYAVLKAQFSATAALAATGDATALGGLESAGKAFLDAAKNNASSREQYLRDVALVAQGVDKGIFAAEETADYAQLQLDALKNATSILADINANTAATAAALGVASTQSSSTIQTPPTNSQLVDAAATSSSATAVPSGATSSGDSNALLIEQNETMIRQNARIVEALTKLERYWSRVDGDGLLVRTDADTPLNVVSDA